MKKDNERVFYMCWTYVAIMHLYSTYVAHRPSTANALQDKAERINNDEILSAFTIINTLKLYISFQ